MRRLFYLSFLLFPAAVLGQTGTVQNFCVQGASQATTSGLNSSNYLQGIIRQCKVTVYLTGTTNKATIYADGNDTPLVNPFTADTNGLWLFYATVGQGYDVVLSGGIPPNTYPSPVTLTDQFPSSGLVSGLQVAATPPIEVNGGQGPVGAGTATFSCANGCTNIEMQYTAPVAGQYVVLNANSGASGDTSCPEHPGFTVSSVSSLSPFSGSILRQNSNFLACGLTTGEIVWTGATLPAGIPASNVMAIYMGYIYSMVCTNNLCGTPTGTVNGNGVPPISELFQVGLGTYTYEVCSSSCGSFDYATAAWQLENTSGGTWTTPPWGSIMTAIPLMFVYYTGTPITSPTAINVAPPLLYSQDALSLPLPDNAGQDVGSSITANQYIANIPGYGPVSSTSSSLLGLTPGANVCFIPETSNTSTTPSFSLSSAATGFTITLKDGTALSTSPPDIAAGHTACVVLDPNDGGQSYWQLINPQVSGGSGVVSFNTRTGDVVLAAADVNAVDDITNNTSGTAAALSAPSALPGGTTAATQTCDTNLADVATGQYVAECAAGGGGIGAPTLAQAANNIVDGTSGAGTSVELTNPVLAGDAIVLDFQHTDTTPITASDITDTLGNSFIETSSDGAWFAQFVACGSNGGSETVSWPTNYSLTAIYEFKNVAATNCVDAYNGGQVTVPTSTANTGNIATSVANDLIFVSGYTRSTPVTFTEANSYTSTQGNVTSATDTLDYESWYGLQATPATISDTVTSSIPQDNTFAASILALFPLVSLPASSTEFTVPNASSTGTTINSLAILTGAPSTAVIATTANTGGVIGVVVSGAGTTGSATIQTNGEAYCNFDGATTAGDYVQISSLTDGDCGDTASASYPASGQVIGRVLSTNASAGRYALDLFPSEIKASSGGSGGFTQIGQTIVTGSPVSTIHFASIPGSYTNLKLVFNAIASSSGGSMAAVFNSDTGGDYWYTVTYTFGSGASWGGPSPSTHANAMDLGDVSTTVSSVATCEIPSYSSSVLLIHTTCQGNYYDTPNGVEQFYNYDGSWHPGTSQAITDILLSVAGDTFAVGSTVTLYGEQ